jgi:hypothetical protein
MTAEVVGDIVTIAALVRAGSSAAFHFRSKYSSARCIGIRVAVEAAGLLVSSVTVEGEEQLLGAGMPAELLGTEPVYWDRQKADGPGLVLTLENYGADDVHAGVACEFVEDLITAVTTEWN